MRRFRPQFLVAFNAWIATNLLHNPKAPPGPTYMPQYQLPAQPGVRYALVAFGSVPLILSIVLILRQPGLPS